jgi:hypothetical protein
MAPIGLDQLCEILPEVRRKAAAKGRSAEVERLVATAAKGVDITQPIKVLLGQLDGPDLDERGVGLPGLGPGTPITEYYECPYEPRCGRKSRREPSGPIPQCHRKPTTSNMQLV